MPGDPKEFREYARGGPELAADCSEIMVQVDGDRLIATLPGTSFVAAYHKQRDGAGIVQAEATMNDSASAMSRQDFEDLAWEAANQRARELGWLA